MAISAAMKARAKLAAYSVLVMGLSPTAFRFGHSLADSSIVQRLIRITRSFSRHILDDRFHEGGNRGTDDLLADSSFAVSGTRSGIMARWRQAVEAAMTDEEIGSLTCLSRSRTEPASRGERARMALSSR